MTESDLTQLLHLLDLRDIGPATFEGRSPRQPSQRVFGGQVAAQALVAAGRTVGSERRVHSLHAYFVRPGDTTTPIVYDVDTLRDGRSFTTRRVVASQPHGVIFTMAASFQVEEAGIEHHGPMPVAPRPDELPTMPERIERAGHDVAAFWPRPWAIDLRPLDDPPWMSSHQEVREQVLAWLRANGDLPDDPLLHACLLTYASDLTLMDSVLSPHGMAWDDAALSDSSASLDHAIWFHRPFRTDEWLLYAQRSPTAAGARGLAIGEFWTETGVHVATVVQEGLLRLRNQP